MSGMPHVTVGVGPLSEAEVVAVARAEAGVTLSAEALSAIEASRKIVEALAHDTTPHYGISTGFGALATTSIPTDRRAALQRALIRSHAAGSGPEVEREVVRAMMLLRLSTLATGRTGIRPVVANTLAALLDRGITPVVREFGSLGCSGDLAPLAHVALALLGEGEVRDPAGRLRLAADVLAEHGISPVELAEKEGLALINGTDGMLGQLILACADLDLLLRTADITAAMSVEAMLGTAAVFAADLQALRPQPGQSVAAANMRALLAGSPIIASHAGPDCAYVQDAYSMRCAPQVAGAARDTVVHARRVAGYELAAAIDNPVVTPSGAVESNGNFHGAPVGYVLDFLAIPVADVASMSERRTDRMLDVGRSRGLPPVPRRGRRRRLRAHDRPVHPGCGGVRAETVGGAGVGGLDPVVGHAGGPRFDGLVGRPKAAPSDRRVGPGARGGAAHRGARYRPAGTLGSGAGDERCDRGAATQRRRAGTGSVPRARDRGGGDVRKVRRGRGGGGVRPAGAARLSRPEDQTVSARGPQSSVSRVGAADAVGLAMISRPPFPSRRWRLTWGSGVGGPVMRLCDQCNSSLLVMESIRGPGLEGDTR